MKETWKKQYIGGGCWYWKKIYPTGRCKAVSGGRLNKKEETFLEVQRYIYLALRQVNIGS